MKKVVTKKGNIFCIDIDNQKRYFQYVADDKTELNSSVIRVFKRIYPTNHIPKMEEIINDEIDFYAHTVLKVGVWKGAWTKVGFINDLGNTEDIYFKWFDKDWYTWKINNEMIDIKDCWRDLEKCHLGIVFSYKSILSRIRTGKFPQEVDLLA